MKSPFKGWSTVVCVMGSPFYCHGRQGQPLIGWRQSRSRVRPFGQGFNAVLVAVTAADPGCWQSCPLCPLPSVEVMEPFGSIAWMGLFCYCPLSLLAQLQSRWRGSQSDSKCQGWKLQAQSAPECSWVWDMLSKLRHVEVLVQHCSSTTNYCRSGTGDIKAHISLLSVNFRPLCNCCLKSVSRKASYAKDEHSKIYHSVGAPQ